MDNPKSNCIIRFIREPGGWTQGQPAYLQDIHDHHEAKAFLVRELRCNDDVKVVSIVSVKPALVTK